MAQLAKQVDCKSLWAKGMHAKTTQEKESCTAVLTAKDLSIVWGSDPRYWKWVSIPDPNSGEVLSVAELIEVCWLQIDGKYPAEDLIKGRQYEVDFIVELKDDLVMNGPVTLKLTDPDGTTHERQEDLTNMPRNEWISLKVGQFNNVMCTCDKNVKFSLNGHDGTTWKKGLTIIGAIIWATV